MNERLNNNKPAQAYRAGGHSSDEGADREDFDDEANEAPEDDDLKRDWYIFYMFVFI